MPIAAGARLGPYEIVAPLGAGGMGVVYKARDSRLDRFVALKTIAADAAHTAEALQRFEREARAISSLSHPHICAVYDVGNADGIEYLVMELLEGETLAARLARGPLPIDAMLQIGVEIAEALAAAHARGIVHRDLKPGNVMLTSSGVKLLDFGLAKAAAQVTSGEASTAKMPAPLTEQGTILGTAAYMAPEQIQGQPATARSDVFALGAVLHEMATGRRVFTGNTSVAIAAAILHQDPPPIVSARADVPPSFDRLVRACLVKDPAARWQTAHDATIVLADIADDRRRPPAVQARRRERLSWLPWAVATASVVVAGVMWLRPSQAGAPPVAPFDVQIAPPPGTTYSHEVEGLTFALSPDGEQLAFIASGQIWIRPLGEIKAKPVPDTERAYSLFWSPDGKSLAWFEKGLLRKLEVARGIPLTLCKVDPRRQYTGTWSKTGQILFAAPVGDKIQSVFDDGGAVVTTLVTTDPAKEEIRLRFPWFLPDGHRFLYSVRLEDGTNRLMLWAPDVPPRPLGSFDSIVQYVEPASSLVFVVDGTLMTQRVDLDAVKMMGQILPVANSVNFFLSTGWAAFATARDGTVVYQSQRDRDHLAWVDRTTGQETGVKAAPGHYGEIRLASGGHSAVLTRAVPKTGSPNILLLDLDSERDKPLTTNERVTDIGPLLFDQHALFYASTTGGGAPQLRRKDLDTPGDVPLLPRSQRFQHAWDMTRDGKTLVYSERSEETDPNLWTLLLAGTPSPEPLRTSTTSATDARLSPDGRNFTFTGSEPRRPDEVYVMPWAGEARQAVSAGRGSRARWSSESEILYLSGNSVVSVHVLSQSPRLQLSRPEPLFPINDKGWGDFDVAPGGKKMLAIVRDIVAAEEPLIAKLHAVAAPVSKR